RLVMQDRAVAAAHERTDLHPGRQRPPLASWERGWGRGHSLPQSADDGAERRKVIGRRWEVAACLGFRRMPMPRQGVHAGLHVIGVRVTERTNERDLVSKLRRARQQFAETHAGDAGRDRAELAALRRRTVRLWIPRLLLRMATM